MKATPASTMSTLTRTTMKARAMTIKATMKTERTTKFETKIIQKKKRNSAISKLTKMVMSKIRNSVINNFIFWWR